MPLNLNFDYINYIIGFKRIYQTRPGAHYLNLA